MPLGFLPSAERKLQGTLSDGITALATEMTVSNPPSVNELPTYLELEPDAEDTDQRETVRVIDVNGQVCTIERGVYSSGVGVPHDPGVTYKQKIAAVAWQAIIDAVMAGYLLVDPSIDLTRTDADTFRIEAADYTSYFTVGRILRFNANDANVAVVLSSTLNSGDTVVELQSGSVPNPLTSVEIAVAPRGGTNQYAYPSSIQNASYIYAADSVGTDAYAVSISPTPATYVTGMFIAFKAGTANTGAATLNVNGLGAKTIKKNLDEDLTDNDIKANQITLVMYDGTNFQLLSRPNRVGWTELTDGATVTVDLSKGNKFRLKEMGGNRTFAVTNPKEGMIFLVKIQQDGTGTRTITHPTSSRAFATTDVDATNNTIAVGFDVPTGTKVQVSSSGTLPAGLSAATNYYVIRNSATLVKLATSLANAQAGTAIDITTQGSGNHTMTFYVKWKDQTEPDESTGKYLWDSFIFEVYSVHSSDSGAFILEGHAAEIGVA